MVKTNDVVELVHVKQLTWLTYSIWSYNETWRDEQVASMDLGDQCQQSMVAMVSHTFTWLTDHDRTIEWPISRSFPKMVLTRTTEGPCWHMARDTMHREVAPIDLGDRCRPMASGIVQEMFIWSTDYPETIRWALR